MRKAFEVYNLSMQECIDLASLGYCTINGERFFRLAKYESLQLANDACQPGDILAANIHMFFILSKIQKYEKQSTTHQFCH